MPGKSPNLRTVSRVFRQSDLGCGWLVHWPLMRAFFQDAAHGKQALSARKFIEQAEGLLMMVAGVDEKDAFRRLQSFAAKKNQKLIQAAQMILAVEKALQPGLRS
jgi:AmiR/NasT family two-component response regulator